MGNRYTLIVIVFMVLFAKNSPAQDPNIAIDSLYKKALAEKTDSGYVYIMLQSANYAFEFNKEKFYRYLKAAFIKADESRNIKTICTANIFASGIYSSRYNIAGNLDTALSYANTALELIKNTNLAESQAWANIALARVYRLKDQEVKVLLYN